MGQIGTTSWRTALRRGAWPALAMVAMLAVALSATAGTALAGQGQDGGLTLDRQSQTPSACSGHGATLLVNVHFVLTNDADSGFAGNAWANDTIGRKLQVWQEADGSFCAVVTDEGSFVTYAGTSPNQTGTVDAGVTGVLQGGYVATLPAGATLNPDPAYATRGNLGTFDLGCNGTFNCPGAHPSFTSYVTGGYALPSWGWIYRTPQNGTWVNQSSGSAGDITSP